MNTSVTTSSMITNMNTTAITVSARSSAPSTSPARLITSSVSLLDIGLPGALLGAARGEQIVELLQRGGGLLAAAVEPARPLLADALELVLDVGARRLRQRIEADAFVLHLLLGDFAFLFDAGAGLRRNRLRSLVHRLLHVVGQLVPDRLVDGIGDDEAAEADAFGGVLDQLVEAIGHDAVQRKQQSVHRAA